MRITLAATWICILLTSSLFAAEPIQLKILYSGNPGSDRMVEFESFLKTHSPEVATTDTSKFTESQANGFDVVIFDWTRTMDDSGRLRSEWRIQNPPRLSQEFSRPAVLIGETGLKISNRDVKLLDHCIGLLESKHDIKLADRVLQRYTGTTFSTAKEWRAWFNMHKDRMFFSDAGGYQFRIQPQ